MDDKVIEWDMQNQKIQCTTFVFGNPSALRLVTIHYYYLFFLSIFK